MSVDHGDGDHGDGDHGDEPTAGLLDSFFDPQDVGASPEAEKRKPRFQCAGSRRVDEDTGKKLCSFKSHKRWYEYCPGCGRPFACLPIKKGKNSATRVTLSEQVLGATKDYVYYPTRIAEVDKVLAGGVVRTLMGLLGSRRGSGKTTMLLQMCDGYAQGGRKAYFASGEMTQQACIHYAKRIGISNPNVALFGDPKGVDVDTLFDDVLDFGATFLGLDSIQTTVVGDMKGDIGQVAMMDAAANMLVSFAQDKKIAVWVISQLQKQGDFAGSGKVQHLVDVLMRMDVKWGPPKEQGGEAEDTMIRELSLDNKSRQGSQKATALVELVESDIYPGVLPGIRTPSVAKLRELSKLHLVK